jgi:hypothetical protein
MKRIFLLISGIAFSLTVNAQVTFEVHGKGGMGSTWLFNKNISDQGMEQDYAMAWGSSYGAGINLYYKNIGIGIEGLASKHTGGYSGDRELLGKYSSQVSLKGFQIPVLLKLKSDGGGYLELGVQANGVSKATYAIDYTDSDIFDDTRDETVNYAKNYMSAVLGFGANVKLSKKIPLGLLFGVRLNYGFADAKGVDALGYNLDNSLKYQTYEKTNAASGAVMIGLTYGIELK